MFDEEPQYGPGEFGLFPIVKKAVDDALHVGGMQNWDEALKLARKL